MVLMNHGLFTFGEDDRIAYERHVELIDRAERWLDDKAPRSLGPVGGAGESPEPPRDAPDPVALASLRREISVAAGRPMIVGHRCDDAVRRFVSRDDLDSIASSGPLTPDHVIRTKRLPMIGTDVADYVRSYEAYVDAHRGGVDGQLEPVDPAPRVVLDPVLGMLAVGGTWVDASIAADIYERTMPVIERASDHLGGYHALPAEDIFDVEYWELEQAKLRRRPEPAELAGHVAVVTGASGSSDRTSRRSGRDSSPSTIWAGFFPGGAKAKDPAQILGWDRSPSFRAALSSPVWTAPRRPTTTKPCLARAWA